MPCGTTMIGPQCIELLSNKLKMHMYIHTCTTFLRKGASCQRTKVVTNFFAKSNVKALECPGYNLNLIENLWTEIQDKVAEKQP